MRVTLEWFSALSVGVKAIVAAIFVAAVLLMSANIAAMRGRFDGLRPILAEKPNMNAITFTATINGVQRTRTYTRNENESDADFEIRAEAAWAAYVNRIENG